MKVMRKKLVNKKRDKMKEWPRETLVDHIRNYHNQELLDYDEEGNRRDLPIAMIAQNVAEHNYEMTDNQYYAMLDGFTRITTPEMKVVGVSYYPYFGFDKPTARDFKMERVYAKGVLSKYDVDYVLEPEPENEFDPNAVRVSIQDKNGMLQQIGYVAKSFLDKHPIKETMIVEGTMEDHSNGNFKNLSYNISFDTEMLDERLAHHIATFEEVEDDLDIEKANEDIQLTLDDLMDLESSKDTLEQ